jgi:uncharacterized Zn-binding protein involved in type VI secretion
MMEDDMTTGVQSLVSGIVDAKSVPALSKVGPNTRVLTATAPVGVLGDVVTFPPSPEFTATVTGTWIMGSARVSAGGLPVITQTAQSTTVMVNGLPGGPMIVLVPDTRVRAS